MESSRTQRGNPEQALAAHVVAWLAAQHWDVYEEVKIQRRGSSRVADIVAVRGPVVWVIECKRSFNLQVIAQAGEWGATRRSVAVPACPREGKGRTSPLRAFARSVCGKFDVGVLEVGRHGHVYEALPAPILRANRRESQRVRSALHEGQKRCAKAGSARGGHWTPYRETMNAVRLVLGNRPGLTLEEILRHLKTHHYRTDASALKSLGTALREYESAWCYVDDSVWRARYYLVEQVPEHVALRSDLFPAPPASASA